MKTLFDNRAKEEILTRLGRLTPETPAQWGKMNARQVICHLADQLCIALGETPAATGKGILSKWPVNVLMISVLPWPKGAPSPREAWVSQPGDWSEDLQRLQQMIAAFEENRFRNSSPDHPIFGRLSPRMWSRLSYRHLDHHLRQFGV